MKQDNQSLIIYFRNILKDKTKSIIEKDNAREQLIKLIEKEKWNAKNVDTKLKQKITLK